jgi:hypothetical protein
VRSAFLRAVRNTSSSSYTEAGSTGISVGFAAFCSIERPYRPECSVLTVSTRDEMTVQDKGCSLSVVC